MTHDIVDDPTKLRTRYEALKSARKTVEGQWQEIERYIIPYRGEFFTDYTSEHQIRWNRHEIYESTALNSARRLAANVQSGLTNPMVKWFDLAFRDKHLNEGQSKEWLEDCGERLWMAISESNFALESNEVYLDMVTMGTSVMVMEPVDREEWQGMDFQTSGLRDSFFEEDHRGQCLRYYQRMELKYAQICDKFGEDKLPPMFRDAAGGGKDIDAKFELFMVIYPRVKNPNKVPYDGAKAAKQRPWGKKYIVAASAEQIGEEDGYYEMPVMIARWGKVSGSQWGHGPGAIAMPDVKTLNELVQLDLRAREKVIDPAIMVTERGLVGDLDLGPGGLNVVRSLDEMEVFESRARFDAVNDKVAQLQENIRNLFNVPDMLLKESPAMTATEVLERREQASRMMGPAAGRIQDDLLDKVIQRGFNLMFRAGQFAEMPEGLDEADLDVEYLGPMARSQRNERVQTINTWLMMILQTASVMPEIVDNVDPDELARETAMMMGVPPSMIREKSEVDKKRKADAEAAEAAKAAAMAQEAGAGMEAMGKGTQAMQEGGMMPGAANANQ